MSRSPGWSPPDTGTEPDSLSRRVESVLADFLARRSTALHTVDPSLAPIADSISSLVLRGGKRLRPAFCYWGWRGAAPDVADDQPVVRLGAALELLHAGALVHDDVMDRSDTRRGRPAVHRRLAAMHTAQQWRGDADWFGESAAILAGDLCLIWADAMFSRAGVPATVADRTRCFFDDMRAEVMAGQYLDLLHQVQDDGGLDSALQVARLKTARYTVERPLHLGGAAGGGSDEILAAYTAYGLPLGEAYQLRDDVLGVFGDPEETGKPAGGDLREGKRTTLVAATLDRCKEADRRWLGDRLGDRGLSSDDLAQVRRLMRECGAVAHIEQLVADRVTQAMAALDGAPVSAPARVALSDLARAATDRSH